MVNKYTVAWLPSPPAKEHTCLTFAGESLIFAVGQWGASHSGSKHRYNCRHHKEVEESEGK